MEIQPQGVLRNMTERLYGDTATGCPTKLDSGEKKLKYGL